ncbi:hypothetical protein Dsin_031660 [Dipteronia sinensis]|uniref:S-acyltransferase n=1 Tax=Dipteronia sinensis TaxID=43782 RepID=A0AAD9ZNB6_9ROSI|nr:hypothetical protein Dsin_031660 [Dipteronia sinensis]
MEAQLESGESDMEIMEQITLSDTSEPEFAGSKLQDDTEDESKVYNKIAGKFGNVLVSLRENLFVIKRVVQDLWFQYVRGKNSDRIRAYHVWPGNNVFFFHGRFVCGPDPRGLLLTTVSIILSSWIFAVYTGNGLSNQSRIIVTISVILTVIVLVNLILVSANDPGIIPRNDQASVEEVGTSDGTRRKKITVNGVELKLKYCQICKIFRPPRSCHCAVCDNCVEKFDHHCPWIGQCIALRNYRFYLAFVISALIFFMYIFAFSVLRIHQRIEKDNIGFIGLLKNCPETLALVSFSFAATCFLGGLAVFHVYLIAMNQTAYENFRQRYADSKNPYDKGMISNYKEVLFVPLPPSRVDFRAEVMPIWQIKSTRDVLR